MDGLLTRALGLVYGVALPTAQDGVAQVTDGGGVGAPAGGSWLDGVYEVDFVWVSLFVGAIGLLLAIHLMRRLTARWRASRS